MNLYPSVPQVALYVNNFLPYTHGWIHRQISDPGCNVGLVLCHERTEEENFPFEPCLVVPFGSHIKEYIKARCWVVFKYLAPSLNTKSRIEFTKALRIQKTNLVHAHFGTNGVFIAPVCKTLGLPLVVTFHGFDISSAPLRWPAYRKELIKLFDQLTYAIAISNEMADRLKAMGCPKHKIQTSYLGVPLNEFPFQDRSKKENGPVIFLHAGRLTAKKGVPDLVYAFAKAFPEKGEAVLWIAGDGEEKEAVNQAIQLAQPAGEVKLWGKLSEQELKRVRNEADVFVINCRTDKAGTKEGLPISILEACATGLPVLTTFHAGIPEAVIQNETGIMVEEYDNEALSKAMKRLIHKSDRIAMGKRAYEYMKEKFSLEVCNHKLRSLYDTAIQK